MAESPRSQSSVIVNSVLRSIFNSGTIDLTGDFVHYDPERNTVYHRRKFKDSAYASVYINGQYLYRRIDVTLTDTCECTLYLVKEETLAYETTITGFWDDEDNTPDTNIIYLIADTICNLLGTPCLIRLTYHEISSIVKRILKEASTPVSPLPRPCTIRYGEKYSDNEYTYRIVHITQSAYEVMKIRYNLLLLDEDACSVIGITQSPGWTHIFSSSDYQYLIFRRPLNY
jgi:hypothetical protein